MNLIIPLSLIVFLTLSPIETSKDPKTVSGRTVMVHLFEWKWANIANECENYLGQQGFGAVQISPPNEHAIVDSPFRPWWQRYQPVSYKLVSRSGSEEEFVDMIRRCNAAGVRIYVDAVINYMSALNGFGCAGSPFNAASRNFPEVPYNASDFSDNKCPTSSGLIEDFKNVTQVRTCMFQNLPNLAVETNHVKETILLYLNKLINIGVAGFRIDAAKYMWPSDIEAIIDKLDNLRADIFGTGKRPFIYQEVIELKNDPIKCTDYLNKGRIIEFKYGSKLSNAVNKEAGEKLRNLRKISDWIELVSDGDAVVLLDNHESQRGTGDTVLTFFEARKYKIANAFMLAWPYGFVHIMSSYTFQRTNNAQGPPSESNGVTKDVIIDEDGACLNGWICEHRWRQIKNMVKFRNIAALAKVTNWWDNGDNQIAFAREGRAFIAINNDEWVMNVKLNTTLPQGTYCDIISGDFQKDHCTGNRIEVDSDGFAQINIGYYEENPIIAIHLQSKI